MATSERDVLAALLRWWRLHDVVRATTRDLITRLRTLGIDTGLEEALVGMEASGLILRSLPDFVVLTRKGMERGLWADQGAI